MVDDLLYVFRTVRGLGFPANHIIAQRSIPLLSQSRLGEPVALECTPTMARHIFHMSLDFKTLLPGLFAVSCSLFDSFFSSRALHKAFPCLIY